MIPTIPPSPASDRHLANLLADLSYSRERVSFDGATPEQVIAVAHLCNVRRQIDELCQNVIMNGNGPWLAVADSLEKVAERCRNIERVTVEQRLLWQSRGEAV